MAGFGGNRQDRQHALHDQETDQGRQGRTPTFGGGKRHGIGYQVAQGEIAQGNGRVHLGATDNGWGALFSRWRRELPIVTSDGPAALSLLLRRPKKTGTRRCPEADLEGPRNRR